jgi:hypothetical protein
MRLVKAAGSSDPTTTGAMRPRAREGRTRSSATRTNGGFRDGGEEVSRGLQPQTTVVVASAHMAVDLIHPMSTCKLVPCTARCSLKDLGGL